MQESRRILDELLIIGGADININSHLFNSNLFSSYVRIAAMYRKKGDLENALKMYREASDILDSIGEKSQRIDIYMAIAELLEKTGRNDDVAFWNERVRMTEK